MEFVLGFIGAGNMGAAAIKSIVKSGKLPADKIFVYDVDMEKLLELKEETGVNLVKSSIEVVEKSDVIILAIKPNTVKPVLEECKSAFDDKKLLISIAVGLPIRFYKDILGYDRKVIRTMPNIAALVGEGMTLISYDQSIDQHELGIAKELFGCLGRVDTLDEKLMSEVTALTGSSPAYVFIFIEAMADAAVQSGISRAKAYKLAAQAVLGSAKMVLDTGKHPGELKDMVCSPAGTTIEAVSALERNSFRYVIIEAMNECTRKAREIGKQFADEK